MIPLDHPHVIAYLAAARTDIGHAGGFVDWLQEQEAGLPELCWWLARCPDEDVRGVQAALVAWDGCHGQEERAEGIDRAYLHETVSKPGHMSRPNYNLWLYYPVLHHEHWCCGGGTEWEQSLARDRAAALRDLRRRQLALYPEVECIATFVVNPSNSWLAPGKRQQTSSTRVGVPSLAASVGCLVVNRCTLEWVGLKSGAVALEQHIMAPDLIPPRAAGPSTEPYLDVGSWGDPHATVEGSFT